MSRPEGNNYFCFSESPKFPRDQTFIAFLYVYTFPSTVAAKQPERATTSTAFEIDQGHVTKDQPIIVLVLFNESIDLLLYTL